MGLRAVAAVTICAAVLGLGAGCSSGGGDHASTDTTTAGPTTAAPDTTNPQASTTTLGPPPPAGTIPFVDLGTDAATDGVSPIGSGCTPGAGTSLPDGRWFGVVRAVDPPAGTLGLDLECLFTGDAANAAATADRASEVPVPNDVYVRNENPAVRTLHAVPDVAVGVITLEKVGGVQFEPTVNGLAAAGSLMDKPVWVQIVDGWVVAIQEQYFP